MITHVPLLSFAAEPLFAPHRWPRKRLAQTVGPTMGAIVLAFAADIWPVLKVSMAQLDFVDFWAPISEASPENRCFCDDARGLFYAGGRPSEWAEGNPTFLPQ